MTKSYLLVLTPAGLKKLPKPSETPSPSQTVVKLDEEDAEIYVVSNGKKAKKLG